MPHFLPCSGKIYWRSGAKYRQPNITSFCNKENDKGKTILYSNDRPQTQGNVLYGLLFLGCSCNKYSMSATMLHWNLLEIHIPCMLVIGPIRVSICVITGVQ